MKSQKEINTATVFENIKTPHLLDGEFVPDLISVGLKKLYFLRLQTI